jgi:hypothetical protein
VFRVKISGPGWIALGALFCALAAAVALMVGTPHIKQAAAGTDSDTAVLAASESPASARPVETPRGVSMVARSIPSENSPPQAGSPPLSASGNSAAALEDGGGPTDKPGVGQSEGPRTSDGASVSMPGEASVGATVGAPQLAAVELSPWQSPPINVPLGERLPALFHDTRPLPAPQRQALDLIANDFIDAVSTTDGAAGDTAEVWESARSEADRRYIILYGFAQYDLLHRAAALERLGEQRAKVNPAP